VLAHTPSAFGEAIAKPPKLSFIRMQHEGGNGNMALGYACPTKKPAFCLDSAAGSATNFGTGQRMPQNRISSQP
jgi:thiamine pyrophosphate-dependent acetolactate synthase large subunit-like protein